MSLLATMRASASALLAERIRMDLVANNVANINTTRTETGGPYKRQYAIFTPDRPQPTFMARVAALFGRSQVPRGVLVSKIQPDPTPGRIVYDPSHPDADKTTGFVEYPNVDIVQEMTDMMGATRAYEANVTVLNAAKTMALKALDIRA